MPVTKKAPAARRGELAKCLTGIDGFDAITGGGLPKGRPSLVCGAAGCGKTLFAVEFLVRGALEYGEPGVLITFEERAHEVVQNVASLGFSLDDLMKRKLIAIDHVRVERSEIEETGDYNLDGLFIRLGHAIDSIGAKRVVLDTIESLFSGLSNYAILRAELRRLFGWLKDKGVTAIITGERGDGQLTRQGLEEYVSDCVVLLDHRVSNQISTRRLRVVKYRGSTHGTNEYPFLIDAAGITVLPVTSAGLAHKGSEERVSTGVPDLDVMLGGKGLFRGSSVLISGTPGSGKSTLAAHFAAASARQGERCLYFAFEESPQQIVRNMRSVGLDLEPLIKSGVLRIRSARPTLFGLETHLAVMHKEIAEFDPSAVVVDPLSTLIHAGDTDEVAPMALRLIDLLKSRNVTGVFTSLTHDGDALEATAVGVSSLMDTWILLRDIEVSGERNRALYILKSRGMGHSNQIREFLMSDRGIRLVNPYLGQEGVFTGSARIAQEERDREREAQLELESARRSAEIARKRAALEAQMAAIKAEMESLSVDSATETRQETGRQERRDAGAARMVESRRMGMTHANGVAVRRAAARRSR